MLWRQPAQAGLTDDTMQHAVGGTIRLAAFWRLSDRAPRSFVTRPPGPERVMFLGEYLGSQLSARCVSNKTMLSIRLASTGRKLRTAEDSSRKLYVIRLTTRQLLPPRITNEILAIPRGQGHFTRREHALSGVHLVRVRVRGGKFVVVLHVVHVVFAVAVHPAEVLVARVRPLRAVWV